MVHNVKRELTAHFEKIVEDMDLLRQQLDEEFNKKLDKQEFIEDKTKTMQFLEQKTDLNEV